MLSNLSAAAIFYCLAGAAVIFSLMTVALKNIFHSALSLIVLLLVVAAVYIYLDAEFLALAQVLIYIGAIMTLIIFAIMLTTRIRDKSIARHNQQKLVAFLIAGFLAGFLIFVLAKFGPMDGSSFKAPSLLDIGRELLTKYVLPFEIISVILLAALIGAAAISRKE